MANGWSLLIGLVAVLLASAAAYVLAPRGENQLIWRHSLILAFASCYIMWALTLLAQLYPLIAPRTSTLRPEHESVPPPAFAM